MEDVTATCDICQKPMYLLVQLRIKPGDGEAEKNDRFVCLFACPKEECFGQLQFDKGFSSGGQGLVKCMVRSVPVENSAEVSKSAAQLPVAPIKASWYSDDNDWGMNDDDNSNALEEAVAAMEQNLDADGALASLKKQSNKPSKSREKPINNETLQSGFGCYILTEQNEPLPARPMLEEDDVGIGESDEKIRNMLARYMAEEEDEDILAALQGTELGGGGGGKGEEDERLSEEDRTLRGFQDRLRRVPRQVLRYALGGMPLWSVPDKNRKTGKQLWNVPECVCCGERRMFEFQVLPSILATLDVDKLSKSRGKVMNSKQSLDEMMTNGMNFGSIAVYTCANAGCRAEWKEAAVVIQKSVDDLPEHNKQASEMDYPSATKVVVEDLDDDDEFELDG